MALSDQDFNTLFQNLREILGPQYPQARVVLFGGIPDAYLGGLALHDTPNIQLMGDLRALRSDTVLANGVTPLLLFLDNVELLHGTHPKISTIAFLRSKFSAELGGGTEFRTLNDTEIEDEITPASTGNATDVDDLIPELYLDGIDNTVDFTFLQGGANAGAAVAKLLVPMYDSANPVVLSGGDPAEANGTGWLLTPELIVTNHHVVNAREKGATDANEEELRFQVKNTRAIFDFNKYDSAVQTARISGLEFFSKELDFAILRLAEPSVRTPLKRRKAVVTTSTDSPFPCNIIQHPMGKPKRAAIRNNLLYSISDDFIRYMTDTDRGSSGAPIFDDAWSVLGLHRAGRRLKKNTDSLATVNEGVLLSSVLAEVEQKKPALYNEINQPTE